MDRRIDIFSLFKQEEKTEKLLIYTAQGVVLDPYEQNTEKKYNNPLPINGLVRQIGFSALHYKYWGKIPVSSIELLTENKNKSLILTADKIKYKNNYYTVYKDDSKNFQYIERPDYCIFILGLKNQV